MPRLDKALHQGRFLACFEACGRVAVASRWARISRTLHYQWMENDPEYPTRFQKAEQRSARMMEDEAVRRGVEGVRKAVRYKGRIVGYEIEHSDRMLELVLKANNPKKFLERSTVAHTDGEGGSLVNALRTLVQES